MATTKKFLDLAGLKIYDGKIKEKIAADIKVVQDDLNTRKVKDVDTTDNGKVALTLVNGKVGVTVNADVVKDSEYSTVKANANNSAAAWGKFLEGTLDSATNPAPKLSELATDVNAQKYASDAKDAAITKAGELDTALETKITTAYKDADTFVKNSLIGTDSDDSDFDTIWGAKAYTDSKIKYLVSNKGQVGKNTDAIAVLNGADTVEGSVAKALKDAKAYTDSKVDGKFDAIGSAEAAKTAAIQAAKDYADATFDTKGSATTAETNAKAYADSLASNYDAAGSAAQALVDAKTYADGLAKNYDAAGSATTAKNEAISEAKTYTDGKISEVNDAISSINTSIAGGVHFIGISSSVITDKGTETPTIDGWTGPVKTGDIVINNAGAEFIWDGSKWQKLGDTTAELERISNLEGHVNTLIGDENTTGSVAKALKDAKAYTDSEITELVGSTGQVGKNTAAIAVLNGADTVEGSVAKALKDAKAYADDKKKEAISDTDTKIATLVGSTGQVGINTAAIATLNGNVSTVGSVDYKIAQAVSNIEASIDTISEAEIMDLFK